MALALGGDGRADPGKVGLRGEEPRAEVRAGVSGTPGVGVWLPAASVAIAQHQYVRPGASRVRSKAPSSVEGAAVTERVRTGTGSPAMPTTTERVSASGRSTRQVPSWETVSVRRGPVVSGGGPGGGAGVPSGGQGAGMVSPASAPRTCIPQTS